MKPRRALLYRLLIPDHVVHHLPTAVSVVGTRRENLGRDPGLVVEEMSQLAKLSDATGSPVTAVDHQHDVLPAMVGQLMDRTRFVGEPVVGRDHARHDPPQIRRRQPRPVERTQPRLLRLTEQSTKEDAGRDDRPSPPAPCHVTPPPARGCRAPRAGAWTRGLDHVTAALGPR